MDPTAADPSNYSLIIKWLALFFCIIFSAYFSSAETSFMSVDKFALRQLVLDGNKKAKKVDTILKNKDAMLSAILIGNNIVNIAASALTTTIMYDLGFSAYLSIATGLLTLVILIFGEIVPKTLAGKYPEIIAMKYSGFLYILIKIFTPAIFLVNIVSKGIMKILRVETKATDPVVTEDVLKTMLDMSLEDDQIQDEEHEIINHVLDFTDSCAKDIMIPKSDVIGIPDDSSYQDIMQCFKDEGYSRLVVLDKEDSNHVVGLLYLKDLIFINESEFDLKETLRTPYFTHETKKTSDILRDLRKSCNSMAIILDEYGDLSGILTVEDLCEEFVGDIRDEYDVDESQIEKVADHSYTVNGTVPLSDVNRKLHVELESENYNSIGGYVIEQLDTFPEEGAKFVSDNLQFEVLSVENNSIETVKISRAEEQNEESEA